MAYSEARGVARVFHFRAKSQVEQKRRVKLCPVDDKGGGADVRQGFLAVLLFFSESLCACTLPLCVFLYLPLHTRFRRTHTGRGWCNIVPLGLFVRRDAGSESCKCGPG